MSAGSSIPEMLGFKAVPFEREQLYSAKSYQVLYQLTEEEAKEVRQNHSRHSSVDLTLSKRYMSDGDYRARVDRACADITHAEPDEETRRVMRRLVQTMNPPSEQARLAVEEVIGELLDDKEPKGAA